jgi:hypothetical protein
MATSAGSAPAAALIRSCGIISPRGSSGEEICDGYCRRNRSGSLAKFAAIRRASSRLKRPIAICRWQRRSPLAPRREAD